MTTENLLSIFIVLIIRGALALIPAHFASLKGRIFWEWWVYGFFFWLIAIIHAAVIDYPVTKHAYPEKSEATAAEQQATYVQPFLCHGSRTGENQNRRPGLTPDLLTWSTAQFATNGR
jgi:hypothetical protein